MKELRRANEILRSASADRPVHLLRVPRAAHGPRGALEDREHTVSRALHDATAVPFDGAAGPLVVGDDEFTPPLGLFAKRVGDPASGEARTRRRWRNLRSRLERTGTHPEQAEGT